MISSPLFHLRHKGISEGCIDTRYVFLKPLASCTSLSLPTVLYVNVNVTSLENITYNKLAKATLVIFDW